MNPAGELAQVANERRPTEPALGKLSAESERVALATLTAIMS